jgi:hypothetical protein
MNTVRFAVRTLWAASAITLLTASTVRAVMFASTDDPAFNTSAPAGALANSGWQWQGAWGGFLGTPVSPQYFAAAQHVGGSVGQSFFLNGAAYKTIAYFDCPNSDLRLWKIEGAFPTYAELYSGSDEIGKLMMVFGRGTQSGEDVYATRRTTNYTLQTYTLKELKLKTPDAKKLAATDPLITYTSKTITLPLYTVTTNRVLAGWRWGQSDGVMRWGQNQVMAAGDFLVGEFNPNLGINAGHLSGGDSSGAVFVEENGIWKLAGLNYGVEGPFSTQANDAAFHAALFDKSGLYNGAYLIPDDGTPKPTRFYATRLSAKREWILSVINNP